MHMGSREKGKERRERRRERQRQRENRQTDRQKDTEAYTMRGYEEREREKQCCAESQAIT